MTSIWISRDVGADTVFAWGEKPVCSIGIWRGGACVAAYNLLGDGLQGFRDEWGVGPPEPGECVKVTKKGGK